MITMKLDEYHTALKSQGVPIEDVKFICPRCKTHQSANDLIEAGAGSNFEEVNGYIGFSCIGRFDDTKGCNWTLGGLFSIHELEIITADNERHPRFLPASSQI